MSIQLGDVIDGKYRIERVLGSGGMGMVLEATHLGLEHPVALKVMREEMASDQTLVERFLREARAACRLHGEHVARLLDVGRLADGAPYMVIEFLAGQDLAVLVRRRGPRPIAEAVGYLRQACDALSEAHALGIVHRDIKLQNLFLTHKANGQPSVKVLDFGLSKLRDARTPKLTATGAILGSPHYMSPEQLGDPRRVDPRSDLWALGVVLHRLLADTPPFAGRNMAEICSSIIDAEPQPLSELRDDVPPELEALVLRCLTKDPARRFQTADELSAALEPFSRATTEAAPESTPPRARAETVPMATSGDRPEDSRPESVTVLRPPVRPGTPPAPPDTLSGSSHRTDAPRRSQEARVRWAIVATAALVSAGAVAVGIALVPHQIDRLTGGMAREEMATAFTAPRPSGASPTPAPAPAPVAVDTAVAPSRARNAPVQAPPAPPSQPSPTAKPRDFGGRL
jgi:eukaryotic-like serine/threonine-protein kinase